MRSDRFRGLVDAAESGGSFVSVYFDDSHDTADAGAQLDARLRDIRKHLEEQSVDSEVIEAIDTAVRAKHPPVGRSGRGVIAHGTRIVLDQHLSVPPVTTIIRVSDLPYIVPVVEHGIPHTSYLTVTVDSTGADIALHNGANGASVAHAADATDIGGPQGHAEEAVRRTIREVADRVTRLADERDIDIVFVTGEISARTELMGELPERVAAKAVQLQGGGRTAGTDQSDVEHGIAEEFANRRLAILTDAVERFEAGHGRGLAVDGLAAVTTGLRDGSVDTLVLGDLGAATVVTGDDRVQPADEALPLLAVTIGSALVCADERLTLTDGVGAVLRYADPNIG